MPQAILSLNAGSSSIKFGLFEPAVGRGPVLLSRGVLEDTGPKPSFTARDASGAVLTEQRWDAERSREETLRDLLAWVEDHRGGEALACVGHRVVHGGRDFQGPIRLTSDAIAAIERLTPLAPLHQPRSLEPIRAVVSLRPTLPQVACFDTAFHQTIAPVATRYALPRRFEDDGVRKYGFHGLSYEYIAGYLRDVAPELADRRTVVAHLGSGASLCAMRDGRSVDTTMGFSTLDGLVMGTRCGALDPGVVIHLQEVCGLTPKELEHLLYHQSGLLGVSGVSSDARVLLASEVPHAREAIDLFTFSIARHVAVMANSLGGLECLVFTGGIGEHMAEIRALTCDRLTWLGVGLDPSANRGGEERISQEASSVVVLVVPTDEEIVIARHATSSVAA